MLQTDLTLRCVECGASGLSLQTDGAYDCVSCGHHFLCHSHRNIPILVSSSSRLQTDEILKTQVSSQRVDRKAAQSHWQTGNLTQLLEKSTGRDLLSFGSGDGGDRAWLESKGYNVTSFDIYPGDFTDCICDGHDLPFADASFDIVTSIAVFEHLYQPFVAAREIKRVLKPGGVHVGTVAFLEPFHANSYFHMSHLGITEVHRAAGFNHVEVFPGWPFFVALESSFWIWNRLPAIHMLTRGWQHAKFAVGKSLWTLGYRLKGSKLPSSFQTGYSGSLIFKASS